MFIGSNLKGSKSFWKSRCGELRDMVEQIDYSGGSAEKTTRKNKRAPDISPFQEKFCIEVRLLNDIIDQMVTNGPGPSALRQRLVLLHSDFRFQSRTAQMRAAIFNAALRAHPGVSGANSGSKGYPMTSTSCVHRPIRPHGHWGHCRGNEKSLLGPIRWTNVGLSLD
ncbi:Tripartite motif-containing protein 72 [Frankliniella fusca]|uniref:Tripartite motif-containing protein 72 n=1 Tax=Frankliniella fusca TaxID=407009 RepID=A0AAE1HBH1_9NEOP|nr:Tripartite motif-containing protein 72 [Frankliniella fusca]